MKVLFGRGYRTSPGCKTLTMHVKIKLSSSPRVAALNCLLSPSWAPCIFLFLDSHLSFEFILMCSSWHMCFPAAQWHFLYCKHVHHNTFIISLKTPAWPRGKLLFGLTVGFGHVGCTAVIFLQCCYSFTDTLLVIMQPDIVTGIAWISISFCIVMVME